MVHFPAAVKAQCFSKNAYSDSGHSSQVNRCATFMCASICCESLIQWSRSVERFSFHRQPSLATFQTAFPQITQADLIQRRNETEAVGQDVFHD